MYILISNSLHHFSTWDDPYRQPTIAGDLLPSFRWQISCEGLRYYTSINIERNAIVSKLYSVIIRLLLLLNRCTFVVALTTGAWRRSWRHSPSWRELSLQLFAARLCTRSTLSTIDSWLAIIIICHSYRIKIRKKTI